MIDILHFLKESLVAPVLTGFGFSVGSEKGCAHATITIPYQATCTIARVHQANATTTHPYQAAITIETC